MENINHSDYKQLCKYSFDLLINTLADKKQSICFPEKFKSVKI